MAEVRLSVEGLARLLRDAEAAHAAYEREPGHTDPAWTDWYAAYLYPRLLGLRDYADEPEELPSTEPYLGE